MNDTDIKSSWGRGKDNIDLPGVFRIPTGNLPRLQEKLAKLCRRASKLSLPVIGLSILGESRELMMRYDFVTQKEVPSGEVRFWTYVAVDGVKPVLNGWELCAVLEHLGDAGNLLRTVPTFVGTLPVEYRTQTQSCDHCKVNRNRKDTFLVRHEDGTWKQIGRQCLQDFLPGISVEAMVKMAEYLLRAADMAEGEEGEGGGGPEWMSASLFMGHVAAAMRAEGWVSRKTASMTEGRTSTASTAVMVMFPSPRAKIEPELKPTAADFTRGAAALEYAREHFEANTAALSDYEYNLSVLVGLDTWKIGRHAGLGASVLNFVERLQGKLAERAAAKAASSHVGTVGARQVLTLKLVDHREWESQYGVTHFLKFIEGDGNIVVWKASQPLDKPVLDTDGKTWTRGDVVVGETVELLCTVKEHSDYKGVKQTLVNRGAVLDAETALEERQKAARKAERAAKKAAKAEAAEARVKALAEADWV